MCHSVGSLPPKIAFAVVSFTLGQLGDGLNIFQGVYLVAIGWNEGSIGIALSLMGLTALLVQTIVGDIVDKTTIDRRLFLAGAATVTGSSASAVLFVREGNRDHMLMFVTKIVEGVSSSFIAPCLAALTLATFGPDHFDAIMASNILWGHIGCVASAILAGLAAYVWYPNIKYCFLVIGASALIAIMFMGCLPQGDPLMGRGFRGKVAMDEQGHLEEIADDTDEDDDDEGETDDGGNYRSHQNAKNKQEEGEWAGTTGGGDTRFADATSRGPTVSLDPAHHEHSEPHAASYWSIFSDPKTAVLCLSGFFFHFGNANVLLVLGELMGGDNDDGSVKRTAIPLVAFAIVTAQATMSVATVVGDKLTNKGVGRKPLFLAGLLTLPIRCALIIYWRDAGDSYLLTTQIFDGLGSGFFALMHPYLVADITFGTGRFNVLMGLTASSFGLGATLSNFLGQMAVEKLGHVASLSGSLVISVIPVLLFGLLMPETYGQRGHLGPGHKQMKGAVKPGEYVEMV